MKRRTLLYAAAAAIAGLLVAAAALRKSAHDIPAGTGYTALDLCSRTMLSGEPAAQVRTRYIEPKVQPLPKFWHIEIEPGARVTVSTSLPFSADPRTAVYREGLGCTIVPPGSTVAAVRAQPFRPAPPLPPDARPWPFGEGAPETAKLEGAAAAIEPHATRLFSEDSADLAKHRNTTALLIARDGHLIYERYGQGHTREQPQLGWSMTKTLTAIIAGTLAQQGKLALDQPVGLSRWHGTPKAAITWRALLNMAPGLAWFEGYGGASDTTEMLFSQADQGAWAADRELTSKPDTVFTYATGFSNIAMLGMRELLGGTHQALYDQYQRRLFAPLGIRGGVIEPDASGTPVGGARGFLRPVDWLRLGQLIADAGLWNGAQLVAADWVAFMVAASPASADYGGSIWRQASAHVEQPLRARLPSDLVFFAGHLGQFTIVVPSRKLVVLRMGVDLGGEFDHDPTLQEVLGMVADLLDSRT